MTFIDTFAKSADHYSKRTNLWVGSTGRSTSKSDRVKNVHFSISVFTPP